MSNGLKAGTGSSDARRDSIDELANDGNLEQLSGQKGSGPSLSKIEEAESGSGVSSNRTTRTAREFDRQMESFIERDDVPEELKIGVREYFKTIHEVESK
ncbi:hypothetical protein [Rubritalea sp.]|uniref:hypothetical protein n=1 Tax=Rubritalea sp. TaxID=2109375 RepID=UPI003EF97ED8